MASIVWMAVFVLLMAELFITALLVLPLPRFFRKLMAKKIFTYDLAKRFRFTSNFIILGLLLAVSDAMNTLRHLEYKEEASAEGSNPSFQDARAGYIGVSFDKQRKFRAERNVLYLAGFSLTLVFVIARLIELMQENIKVEEDKDALTKQLKDVGEAASQATSIPTTDISAGDTELQTLRRRPNATTDSTDKTD